MVFSKLSTEFRLYRDKRNLRFAFVRENKLDRPRTESANSIKQAMDLFVVWESGF